MNRSFTSNVLKISLCAAFVTVCLAGCEQQGLRSTSHQTSSEKILPTVSYEPQSYVQFEHQDWTKNATIYQINTRQFTPEGTFVAAAKQLPRLKKLGVDILWLMPIHPIGDVNRKGSLGSPYAVKDFFDVNPEFGSKDDFRQFMSAAHAQGFHVILDWVGNHTAWDNVIREAHPDWYEQDYKGEAHSTPWFDWDDIIELNYHSPELRQYMTDAMVYWVKEFGVDGYRCDAAGFVPLDFWNNAVTALRQVKPVFMLAEWESRDVHAYAFDASYAWTWWDSMHAIAQGKADVTSLFGYYAWREKFYPKDAYRMLYVTNHDKNAWDGTQFEIFGDALNAVTALTFVSDGMPLIYNGQEAGNPKRLAFFEKDPIEWKDHPLNQLLTKLVALKKSNTALWNGHWGATMIHVPNSQPKAVLSFVRQNSQDKVFAVFNFSNSPQDVTFKETLYEGKYQDFDSGKSIQFSKETPLRLAPWEYRVFVKK